MEHSGTLTIAVSKWVCGDFQIHLGKYQPLGLPLVIHSVSCDGPMFWAPRGDSDNEPGLTLGPYEGIGFPQTWMHTRIPWRFCPNAESDLAGLGVGPKHLHFHGLPSSQLILAVHGPHLGRKDEQTRPGSLLLSSLVGLQRGLHSGVVWGALT